MRQLGRTAVEIAADVLEQHRPWPRHAPSVALL
jgi:hypothetical protein